MLISEQELSNADRLLVVTSPKGHQDHRQSFCSPTCLPGQGHIPFSYTRLSPYSLHIPVGLEPWPGEPQDEAAASWTAEAG